MTTSMDVVILTRQRRADLEQALLSVIPQLGPHDTLTVLENGCPDRSTNGLDLAYPQVNFLVEETNLGVAGGRNRLIAEAHGSVVMFLDDDGELAPSGLETVRSAFAEHPTCGVVACRIDDPATGTPRSHEFPARRVSDIDTPRLVTYFIGAGFAVRRSALEAAGLFDDTLFYAGEELDLSYRIIDAGWEIRFEPQARVIHHASAAGRPPGQYFYYHLRNRYRIAARNLPWRFAVTQMVLWTGYFLAKAARQRRVPAALRGWRDGVRGLPAALRERAAISKTSIGYLKDHDGRLWY